MIRECVVTKQYEVKLTLDRYEFDTLKKLACHRKYLRKKLEERKGDEGEGKKIEKLLEFLDYALGLVN